MFQQFPEVHQFFCLMVLLQGNVPHYHAHERVQLADTHPLVTTPYLQLIKKVSEAQYKSCHA